MKEEECNSLRSMYINIYFKGIFLKTNILKAVIY